MDTTTSSQQSLPRRPRLMRRLLVVVMGLTMVMSATVVVAGEKPAEAQSVLDTTMLLFDLSGSMGAVEPDGRTRLAIAQNAMIEAIDGAEPGSQNIGIRSFSDCGVTALEQSPAPVDAASLTATINSFQLGARTDISVALSSVADDFITSSGRKSVILLSDGEQTCPGDPCVTAQNLVASGVDVIVHAIGIGTEGTAAENQLACIANATGGTVISVDRPEDLFAAIDAAITGAPTSGLVLAAVPTCANSALVQDDPSLGALTIGSTYYDSAGTLRVLIIDGDCGFGCNGGFDANCDGQFGDYCNSDFDSQSVSGIGKCLADIDEDVEDPDPGAIAGKSLDELLATYCGHSVSPTFAEACEHYAEGLVFQQRADAAKAAGNNVFLYNFNQTLADAAFDRARAALAAQLPDQPDPRADSSSDDDPATGEDWTCPQFFHSTGSGRTKVTWADDGTPAYYEVTAYEMVPVWPPSNPQTRVRERVAGPSNVATVNPTGPAFRVDRLRAATPYEFDVKAFDRTGTELGTCEGALTTTELFGAKEFTGDDVFGPATDPMCAADYVARIPATEGQEFTSQTLEFSGVLDFAEAEAKVYSYEQSQRLRLFPSEDRFEQLLDQILAIEVGAVAPLQEFSLDESRVHVDGLAYDTDYLLSLRGRSPAGLLQPACYIILSTPLATSLSLGGEVRSVAVCTNISFGEIWVVSESGCTIMRLDTNELRWAESRGAGLGVGVLPVAISYMTIESDSPDFTAWGGVSSCLDGVILTEGLGGCLSVGVDQNVDVNEFIVRTRTTQGGSLSWTVNNTTLYDLPVVDSDLFERRADAVGFYLFMRYDMCRAFPELVPSQSWCELPGPVA